MIYSFQNGVNFHEHDNAAVNDPEQSSSTSALSPSSSFTLSPSPSPPPAVEPPTKQARLSKKVDIGVFVAEKSKGIKMTDHDKYQLISYLARAMNSRHWRVENSSILGSQHIPG